MNVEATEIETLLQALFEDVLTDAQRERLNALVKSDPAARRAYLDHCDMHAMLMWQHGTVRGIESLDTTARPKPRYVNFRRFALSASLAALLAFVVTLSFMALRTQKASPIEDSPAEFAASLTGVKDCHWGAESAALKPGDVLHQGQRVELNDGFAELTFASGAVLTLEGPVSLDVGSAWNATLDKGTLRARVPERASGFRLASASVEIADSGTDYSLVSDGTDATDVFVHTGRVQALQDVKNHGPAAPILRAKEARRFSKAGVSEVGERDRKYARLARAIALDTVKNSTGLRRWSFDDIVNHSSKGSGTSIATNAEINGENPDATHAVAGHLNGALHLDEKSFVKIPVPGISDPSPHTVAFWVRVPQDAPLSGANALLAWEQRANGKGSSRPMRMAWNENPAQGALGVLRTGFRRDTMLGSTSLRDGKWHHVAVVFLPGGGSGPDAPLHVLQYVDGRLEGVPTALEKKRKGANTPDDDATAVESDTLWIGRGIGKEAFTKNRFLGDLDELIVADRALSPQEIEQLVMTNELSNSSRAQEKSD